MEVLHWDKYFRRYNEKYVVVADIKRANSDDPDPIARLRTRESFEVTTLIETHSEKSVSFRIVGGKRVADDPEEGIEAALQFGKDVIEGKIPECRLTDC